MASRTETRLERPFLNNKCLPCPAPLSAPLTRSAARRSTATGKNDSGVPGRVRVAVRLRPRNAEELVADADFADCVELQPELKRLKLQKNNWDSDTYQFDEVLTEYSSQKRVYEVVAKPVIESVLEGYNGTVMAYGQTGTGKTFTLGRLDEEDDSNRGIMVRAVEDILAGISLEHDTVMVSYLQLYMETIQDLLAREKDNIPIVEDPKMGDVSVPGASHVQIRDQKCFVELLQTGEANRFVANTRLNTESSRSHAILMVNVKRIVKENREEGLAVPNQNGSAVLGVKGFPVPTVRKSKLVIVDLAGSERVDKSGVGGHSLDEAKCINLSLTALGKCINALAEGSSHVPIRDSKLTRLLRDSFGGSARTSLVITIGPSPRHRGETTSTIMFGQRAMKVENMVKLKEEFDYKSLCRKLEKEVDKLIVENERQSKGMSDAEELERTFEETLASERSKHQRELTEALQNLEIARAEKERLEKELKQSYQEIQLQRERSTEAELARHQEFSEVLLKHCQEVAEVTERWNSERAHREKLENDLQGLMQKTNSSTKQEEKDKKNQELLTLSQRLDEEIKLRWKLEEENKNLKEKLLKLQYEADETMKTLDKMRSGSCGGSDRPVSTQKINQSRDGGKGQRSTIVKLFEQVGLQNLLALLVSGDDDVRIHALKVVANLAADETNQQKIVAAGGLCSLLMLLESSEDETIRRVAAGAIANLAMNEANQVIIMSQGGVGLLSRTSNEAEDPKTLCMVAGAIANLCGNGKLQSKLKDEGGIRALLGMARSGHLEVQAQVARGIANFAKCESRGAAQGLKRGRSLLIDDGALSWIVSNASNEFATIKRHIELALCHLAQNELNANDLVLGGAFSELVRISRECSREDIRNLAYRAICANQIFQCELQRLQPLC